MHVCKSMPSLRHNHDSFLSDILNSKDFFQILHLPRPFLSLSPNQNDYIQIWNCTPSMVKKQFRQLTLRIHPEDSFLAAQAFDLCCQAYIILSNETKRNEYLSHYLQFHYQNLQNKYIQKDKKEDFFVKNAKEKAKQKQNTEDTEQKRLAIINQLRQKWEKKRKVNCSLDEYQTVSHTLSPRSPLPTPTGIYTSDDCDDDGYDTDDNYYILADDTDNNMIINENPPIKLTQTDLFPDSPMSSMEVDSNDPLSSVSSVSVSPHSHFNFF